MADGPSEASFTDIDMLMDVAAVANDKSVDVDSLRVVGGLVAGEDPSSDGGLSSDIEISSSSDGSEESGELGSDGAFRRVQRAHLHRLEIKRATSWAAQVEAYHQT
jgi:hypothetical protein